MRISILRQPLYYVLSNYLGLYVLVDDPVNAILDSRSLIIYNPTALSNPTSCLNPTQTLNARREFGRNPKLVVSKVGSFCVRREADDFLYRIVDHSDTSVLDENA